MRKKMIEREWQMTLYRKSKINENNNIHFINLIYILDSILSYLKRC